MGQKIPLGFDPEPRVHSLFLAPGTGQKPGPGWVRGLPGVRKSNPVLCPGGQGIIGARNVDLRELRIDLYYSLYTSPRVFSV